MHILDQVSGPVIYAHRGASAHAPENTLAAFTLALEHSADGVELDAKLSLDGEVMVIHDQTVDRTTNGSGQVRGMTRAQIQALDAGSKFGPAFAGEPAPTLRQVFEAVGARTLINVELTNYASPRDALVDQVARLVIEYGLQERIIFSSFSPWNLLRARRLLPEVPVAMLTLPGAPGSLLRGWVGRWFAPRYLNPYTSDVTVASMAAARRHGRRVNAWTVNDPAEMRRLLKLGIDGIITDDPRLARRVVEEK